jgi:hypothetical protein
MVSAQNGAARRIQASRGSKEASTCRREAAALTVQWGGFGDSNCAHGGKILHSPFWRFDFGFMEKEKKKKGKRGLGCAQPGKYLTLGIVKILPTTSVIPTWPTVGKIRIKTF